MSGSEGWMGFGVWGRQNPDGTKVLAAVTREAGGRLAVGPGWMERGARMDGTPMVPGQRQDWVGEVVNKK